MKQKVSTPVALVVAAVVLLLLCGVLYRKYMYQPVYSAADIGAKFKSAKSGNSAPPNVRQQNGNP